MNSSWSYPYLKYKVYIIKPNIGLNTCTDAYNWKKSEENLVVQSNHCGKIKIKKLFASILLVFNNA